MRRIIGYVGLVLSAGVCGCDAQADPNYQGEALATLQGRVETTMDVQSAEVGILWFTSNPGDECSGPTRRCLMQSYDFSNDNPEGLACIEACGPQPDCEDLEAIDVWEPCMAECGVPEAVVEYESNLTLCSSSFTGQSVPVTGEFPARFELDLLAAPPDSALLPDETGSRVAVAYIAALESGVENVTVESGYQCTPSWLLGGSAAHILVYAGDPVQPGSGWATLLGGPLDAGYHLMQVAREHICLTSRTGVAVDPDADTSESDNEYYSQAEDLCGNGVCEPGAPNGETCDNCSDCDCLLDDGAAPTSTGILINGPGYFCVDSPHSVTEAPEGFDSELTLTLTAEGYVAWPRL